MRKENVILVFVSILLQWNIAHALKCQSCIGDCTGANSIECGANESCFTKEQRIDGVVRNTQKGCLNTQSCSAMSTDSTIVQTCCNTDFCNAATKPYPGGGTGPLTCYGCNDYFCLTKTDVVCKPGEQCVTKKTKAIAGIYLRKLGCSNTTICNTVTTEEIAGSSQSVDNVCCNSNLCNFAVALKAPSMAAIGALLLLWIARLS